MAERTPVRIYTADEQYHGFAALAKELDQWQAKVEALAAEVSLRDEAVAQCEVEYLKLYHKAILENRKQKDSLAKSEATLVSSDLLLKFKIERGLRDSAKEALWNARSRVQDVRQKMSNFQSVASMARAEAELAGR